MKLSDYIAYYLSKQGIKHVFAVSGGASLHLIHSLKDAHGIDFICPQHEQAGAMAADGYSRATGNIGAAISTSGPGATNMITGICGAYYDSIPVMFITGQVATFRMKGDLGIRQMGFQETDIVEMCKPVTKYAVRVDDPLKIRYEMEKAYYLAKTGRPGPVLIDVPDNVQRAEIEPDQLIPYTEKKNIEVLECSAVGACVHRCINILKLSRRPVLILGWGLRLAKAEEEAKEFIEKLGMPVVLTWAVADLLPNDHHLLIGTFGTHGTRYGNFAVQNADLIISIGCRLDTKATGSPITTFAREAKKIVVDIDKNELLKFEKIGLKIDELVNCDALVFLRSFLELSRHANTSYSSWIEKILLWKEKYKICQSHYYLEEEVNPYVFVKSLSKFSSCGDIFCLDTGCTLAWFMQAFELKEHQRIFHDWNNTAMGWALPASIGISFAAGNGRNIICVTGDGSLQMNIQELITVMRHNLPIKILLIDNGGYSMIRQTQDQWLNSEYLASSVEGGLAFPDFIEVAKSYGYQTFQINRNNELNLLKDVFNCTGPVFCVIKINSHHRVFPQVKYGRPNEDSEPLLDRDEFVANMIVKPLHGSLSK
jgi:acetolactate synthase-1/2/3 large subunit